MSEVIWTDEKQIREITNLISNAVLSASVLGYSNANQDKLVAIITETSVEIGKSYTRFLNKEANSISQKGDE